MAEATVRYRMMTAADVGSVPIDHQGNVAEVRARIADLGSSAVLVFDGAQHVGQLQFRRYDPNLVSPNGLMDPLYWGDFQAVERPSLPPSAITLYCYHVGQTGPGETRDAVYQGRGIGLGLLSALIDWADASDVEAIVAKAVPPYRPLAVFMGGHPAAVYEDQGFTAVARWVDADIRTRLESMLAGEQGADLATALRALRDEGVDLEAMSQVAMMVRRRGAG